MKEDVKHFLIDCSNFKDFQIELNEKLLTADTIPSVENLLGRPRWFNDVFNYVLQTQRSL